MKKYIISLTVLLSIFTLTLNLIDKEFKDKSFMEKDIIEDVNTTHRLSAIIENVVSNEFTENDIVYRITPDAENGDYVSVVKCNSVNQEVTLLNEVIINDTTYRVKKISMNAFKSNDTVVTVNFPDNLEVIDLLSFNECENLTNLNFSTQSNLKTIENTAFVTCSKLEVVNFPASLETIKENAFVECALTTVYLNSYIPDLTLSAFPGTNDPGLFLDVIVLEQHYQDYQDNNINTRNLTKEITVELDYNGGVYNGESSISYQRLFDREFNYIKNDNGSWSPNWDLTNDFLPKPVKDDFYFNKFIDDNGESLSTLRVINDEVQFKANYQGLFDVDIVNDCYIINGVSEFYLEEYFKDKGVSALSSVLTIPSQYNDGTNGTKDVVNLGSFFKVGDDTVEFLYIEPTIDDVKFGIFLDDNYTVILNSKQQYDSMINKILPEVTAVITYEVEVKLINEDESSLVNRLFGFDFDYVKNNDGSWEQVDISLSASNKEDLYFVNYINSNNEVLSAQTTVTHDMYYVAIYQGLYEVELVGDNYLITGLSQFYLDAYLADKGVSAVTNVLTIPNQYDDGNNGLKDVLGLADNFTIPTTVGFLYVNSNSTYFENNLLSSNDSVIIIASSLSQYELIQSITTATVTYEVEVKLINEDESSLVNRLFGFDFDYVKNNDGSWEQVDISLSASNKEDLYFVNYINSNNEVLSAQTTVTHDMYYVAIYQGLYEVELVGDNYLITGLSQFYLDAYLADKGVSAVTNVLTIPNQYDDGNNRLKDVLGLADNFTIPTTVEFLYLPTGLTYGTNILNDSTNLLVITDKPTYDSLVIENENVKVTYIVNVTINTDNSSDNYVLERLFNKTINYVKNDDFTWSLDNDFELETPTKEGYTFSGFFDSLNNEFDIDTVLTVDVEYKAKYTLIVVPEVDDNNDGDTDIDTDSGLAGIAKLDKLIQDYDIILIVMLSTANLLLFIIGTRLKTKKKNRQMVIRSTALPLLLVLSNSSIAVLVLSGLILLQCLYIVYLLLTTNKLGIIEVEAEEEVIETNSVLQEPLPRDAVIQEVVKEKKESIVETKEETPSETKEDVKELEAIIDEEEEIELPQILEVIEGDAPLRAILDVSNLDDSDEELEETTDEDEENEATETADEEVVTAKISSETGKMILIRYKKSFSARLNLSEDITKDYHSALKNKLLSYKKVKSRTSWNYEAFNFGRQQAAKMNIRGKSLFIYLPLEPSDYEDSKYSFKDCSHIKKYEQLPFRVRVRSNRGLKHAFELIETVMENFETTEIKDYDQVNYYQRNRGFDKLLSEGLIKEVIDETTFKDLTEINKEFLDSNKIKSIDLETIKDIKFSDDVMTEAVVNIKTQNTSGKKDIINIDTISKHYKDNEVVSVKTLKEKKLIPGSVKNVKCLARGTLDKKLSFELQSYSKDAIKMIIITGGKII